MVRIGLTTILAIFGISGFLSYFYLDIRGFYRNPANRWWVGLLATDLPLLSITFVILIWMLWNPLLHNAIWPLFVVGFLVSLVLGQSVTSPYIWQIGGQILENGCKNEELNEFIAFCPLPGQKEERKIASPPSALATEVQALELLSSSCSILPKTARLHHRQLVLSADRKQSYY